MPVPNELLFKDVSISFTPHPITRKLNVLNNDEAVKRALKNLIFTNLYERPYQPLLGSDIIRQLFENFTPFTRHIIEKNIRTVVNNYDPRIDIVDIRLAENTEDLNLLDVSIVFSILNRAEPVTLNVTLSRVR